PAFRKMGQPYEQNPLLGPDRRGIISLVTGCLATLFLSVFASLHLNVDPSRRPLKRAVNKLYWVLIGVFAPEYVVYVALVQRLLSRRICQVGRSIKKVRFQGLDSANSVP